MTNCQVLPTAQVQVDMSSVSKEAMQCLDAAVKQFFDAHAADYKEVRGRWSQSTHDAQRTSHMPMSCTDLSTPTLPCRHPRLSQLIHVDACGATALLPIDSDGRACVQGCQSVVLGGAADPMKAKLILNFAYSFNSECWPLPITVPAHAVWFMQSRMCHGCLCN